MREERKEKRPQSVSAWILTVCFVISLVTLVLYLLDLQYDDQFIYFLLVILRYSAFLVFIIAIYKLLLNFYRLIIKRRKFHPVKMLIYFFLLIYGFVIFLIESFIVVISGGNS